MPVTCPKCAAAMEPVTHGDVTVERCTSCKGLWFDLMEHRHLRGARGADAIDTGSPVAGSRTDEQRNINCPKCGARMTHLRDVDNRTIEYEYCPACNGSFFDAGEFVRYRDDGFLGTLRAMFRPRG
jgi:Zn-finger nucleic acid-binding protein